MKIIRIWVDLLCPECYRVLSTNLTTEQFEKEILYGDEPQMCLNCYERHDFGWVFPLAVQKREDEEHVVEIIHIGGAGIKYTLPTPADLTVGGLSNVLDLLLTSSSNKTTRVKWPQAL